jgi:hypothetical protein
MSLKNSFKDDLSENIYTHQKLIDLFPEINSAIKIIFKKIKMGGGSYYCGVMEDLQLTPSI